MALDLKKIIQLEFPNNQYYREETDKKQIVLHHTASGRGVTGDFRHWLNTPQRIATHVIVDFEGVIYQAYSSKYWAHHLGVKQAFLKSNGIENYKTQNKILNQHSIAIEIDAWGGLKYDKENGVWKSWAGKIVPAERVVKYEKKYRGYFGFERYTDAQLCAVKDLLIFWNKRYEIPLHYNEDMWDVSKNALKGKAGVYSHSSYRKDKSDAHPQPELIQMLKGLPS